MKELGEGLFTITEGREFQRGIMSIKKMICGQRRSKKGLVVVKTGVRGKGSGGNARMVA